jgi:hypothetical protein
MRRNFYIFKDYMKTLAIAMITGLFATVAIAQTAPAAPAAKVDCKDVKNKDKAECKPAAAPAKK